MAISSLAMSAPTQSLTPPPKAMKVLDPACKSFPFSPHNIHELEQEKKTKFNRLTKTLRRNAYISFTSHLLGLNARGSSYSVGLKWRTDGTTITVQPAGIVYPVKLQNSIHHLLQILWVYFAWYNAMELLLCNFFFSINLCSLF